MCVYFPAAIFEHQNPTPSCHLLIKALFFFKAPLSLQVAVRAKRIQCSMKSSPWHEVLRDPQHLNSLFFLPPPFFAGHEWHCQMLALINLIIRWATHIQAWVWLALPPAFLPSLISLCRQHNQSHTWGGKMNKQDKTLVPTKVISSKMLSF